MKVTFGLEISHGLETWVIRVDGKVHRTFLSRPHGETAYTLLVHGLRRLGYQPKT